MHCLNHYMQFMLEARQKNYPVEPSAPLIFCMPGPTISVLIGLDQPSLASLGRLSVHFPYSYIPLKSYKQLSAKYEIHLVLKQK